MRLFTGEEIKQAQEEWQNANAYFENVNTTELIDYAIYRLEAARVRYAYMLKCSVEKNPKVC